jgi:hypothetical protein
VSTSTGTIKKATILGSEVSFAHFPNQNNTDVQNYFNIAALIGSHTTLITQWNGAAPISVVQSIQQNSASKVLKFHLFLSPIAITSGRKSPDVPSSVSGSSFCNATVQNAFKQQALSYAALHPDYLGLGTEVNFLTANPAEFQCYLVMEKNTYNAIKQQYPNQVVDVSFQYDVMKQSNGFDVLKQFNGSVDVYAFTTYPAFFNDPQSIPSDYYSSIRNYLPSFTCPYG